MSRNDWAKEIGRWHVWALTIGGVVVLALIVYAGQKDWFDDDTLFGFALLGVGAGVFGAAYALTTRQLKEDARKSLRDAREKVEALTKEIEELKSKLAEEQSNLDTTTDNLKAEVGKLQARADAQERSSREQLEQLTNNLVVASKEITDPDAKDRIERLKQELNAMAPIESATRSIVAAANGVIAQASSLSTAADGLAQPTANAQLKLGEAARFLDAVEDLPEQHRLVGLWVAAGLTIVLLGFLSATGLTITTSGDNSGTGTSASTDTAGTGTDTAPSDTATETTP